MKNRIYILIMVISVAFAATIYFACGGGGGSETSGGGGTGDTTTSAGYSEAGSNALLARRFSYAPGS